MKSSVPLRPGMANLLFFSWLLLALCRLSLSASVFVSIDCGSSVTYKDDYGITWTGDDKYIKTGESLPVPVQSSNSSTRLMETLRVFKNQTKSCYTIDSVKKGRVLLRATFFYGNYDGKSSPPKFDIMFDGYYWGAVNNSGPAPSRFEVIYNMRKDSISFCLGLIEAGQYPYISGLEIRSLEPYMYLGLADQSYPLFTRRRLAFGTNATIRFPDDPYDRLWNRDIFANGTIQVSSDARLSSGLSDDMPPPAVLRTAVTSATPNTSIDFFMALSSNFNSSVYINWYFSEVTLLKPNQTRSFYIYKDNKPFSEPILPPYGNLTEKYVSNLTASANTLFSLVPTQNTTLPPLINAMEVLLLGDYPLLQDGTHKKDVEGLTALQEAFSSLQDWTGDPCLPSAYPWDWVKCSDDYVPRVTTLLLGGYRLKGFLPDFSSMDAIHTINLSNNSLRGNIPDFLATFPDLQILNLENNQFNGTIPASLSSKKGLILRVSGNPELCTSGTSCPSAVTGPPAGNSSVKKTKNILEILLATIISSIIVLQLT